MGPGDLGAPALLKLDVQGFELAALKGCASLLDRFAAIYVECSFVPLYAGQPLADEVLEHLRTQGFRLAGIYNVAHDHEGRAVQADFWCARLLSSNRVANRALRLQPQDFLTARCRVNSASLQGCTT